MGKRKCIWENEPTANEGFVTEIINTHSIVLPPEFTEIGATKKPFGRNRRTILMS